MHFLSPLLKSKMIEQPTCSLNDRALKISSQFSELASVDLFSEVRENRRDMIDPARRVWIPMLVQLPTPFAKSQT